MFLTNNTLLQEIISSSLQCVSTLFDTQNIGTQVHSDVIKYLHIHS